MKLSVEQNIAVSFEGNSYVTACPGSGKTRALTAKLSLGMKNLTSKKMKVLAVTFTNRAANEIKLRIEQDEYFDSKKLWTGTIHSFVLEWILRPYAGYLECLNDGFVIADEYETKKIITELKRSEGVGFFDDVNTAYDRSGNVSNADPKARIVEAKYREILSERRKIDFDQALYFSLLILDSRPEIAATLGAIFRLICVDEVQDTQDLQYAILSKIYNSSLSKPNLFIVGDKNQAIYENIGGVSKTLDELNEEFEGSNMTPFSFSENYRSTQRIADYCSYFRNTQGISSRADHANEMGKILYSNQEIDKQDLPTSIANIVQSELNDGIAENEICIIAPQWSPIRSLSRELIGLLPDVKFDAPSLSPFYGQQDNFWLTVAKLALTIPSGRLFSTRMRWANEVLMNLQNNFHVAIDVTAKKLLLIINSFKTDTLVGTNYLDECFAYLLLGLGADLNEEKGLAESHDLFFEKARSNMEASEGEYDNDVNVFRAFFKESTGVVINSCHGVKGEEYETVIAFGLLKGFVPNWDDIIQKPDHVGNSSESKMMYVIASRAKRNLYLISESGRKTKARNAYETSPLLKSYTYNYK